MSLSDSTNTTAESADVQTIERNVDIGTPPQAPTPPPVVEQSPANQKTQRPDDIPEKFWDAEKGEVRARELAKAYAELEKKHSTRTDQKGNGTDPAQPAVPELPQHLQRFGDEFAKLGKLSETSYQELAERHGLSRQYVDTYIHGLQAKQAAYTSAVYSEAGGEEGFRQLSDWARVSLSRDELAAVDAAFKSGDTRQATFTVRALQARYEAENGREPNLLEGDAPSYSGIPPFESKAEMVKAMSDPRYSTDEKYREEVARRLAYSTVV